MGDLTFAVADDGWRVGMGLDTSIQARRIDNAWNH